MKKLILKYNARIGRDPLPRIQELTEKLGLRIEVANDSKPGLKQVLVVGASDKLHELDRALVRYASITRKAA